MSAQKSNNFLRFLRQNLVLIIIIACVLAITGIILGVSLGKKQPTPVGPSDDTIIDNGNVNDDKKPDENPNKVEKPTFVAPIANYTVGMDYSRDSEYVLVFKKTLNEWSVHNGVDFIAEEGTDVVAISDGVVTSVRNEYGMGNIVEITHADGVVSSYSSLGDEIDVKEGDKVKKGDKIGSVSTSAAYECAEGAHLHLEVKKDGKYVNPANYFEIKKS